MTIAARPTTYNGIQMRSRLEARFAAFLDRARFDWEYEPRAFASSAGQYLPDFLIRKSGLTGPLYVELKGTLGQSWTGPWFVGMAAAMLNLGIIRTSEPGAYLGLIVASAFDEPRAKYPKPRYHFILDEPDLNASEDGYSMGVVGVCERCSTSSFSRLERFTEHQFLCRACGSSGSPVAYLNPLPR